MSEFIPIERGELFSRLFVSHQKRILGLIYALTQNRDVAEDLLQDVAGRLWRKFETFEEGSDFAAWSLAITRFVVLEWRRSSQRIPLPLEEEELHALADSYVEHGAPLTAVHIHLDECLAKVTDRQRRLLREHFAHGYKIVEIAAKWQRSRRAIHKSLKKTKDQLLECIERARSGDTQESCSS